ncbi:hypothetical protein [Photorhabdus hindustanensis]|uniref:Uncharacterized protein n=1 Tax=Photorhabdus hindustanensis TaxID=2918802 RepID=A0A2S8PY21_9GAMM|nr:hypothetical protein [Photorhabdus hindustanensis]PQQ24008.1 hypothetical protein C6H66_17070 [Photorhabdus hindustanensis]
MTTEQRISFKEYLENDNITNDAAAIGKFLDYLADNGGIGEIESGTYTCNSYSRDSEKKPIKPFKLIGAGIGKTILKLSNKGSFLTWRNATGIHIEGITLDCQYSQYSPEEIGNTRIHGFVLCNCNDCSISHSKAIDFCGTGFMGYIDTKDKTDTETNPETDISTNINTDTLQPGEKYKGVFIRNCYAQATKAFNDYMDLKNADNSGNAEELKKKLRKKECNGVLLSNYWYSGISDCTAEDISLFGIELKQNARWNKVINCKAINCQYGFGMGQQTDVKDIGCENNTVIGFKSIKCHHGGIIGKGKCNHINDMYIDFTDIIPDNLKNGFRLQLKSRFNTLSDIKINALQNGRPAIYYEKGANNNYVVISNCTNTDGKLLVAKYIHTNSRSSDTIDNITRLCKSDSNNDDIIASGDLDRNKTHYDHSGTDISS